MFWSGKLIIESKSAHLDSDKHWDKTLQQAKEYIENWYEDGKWEDKETCGYDGANIQVEFEGLEEITPAIFATQLLNSYSIGISFDTDTTIEPKTDFSLCKSPLLLIQPLCRYKKCIKSYLLIKINWRPKL